MGRANGMHHDETLRLYNLSYENGVAEFVSDKMTFMSNCRFENGNLIKFNSEYKAAYEWAMKNKELKQLLDTFYEEYTRNF